MKNAMLDAPRGAEAGNAESGDGRAASGAADRGPVGRGREGQSEEDGSGRGAPGKTEGASQPGSDNDLGRPSGRGTERHAGQRDPGDARDRSAALTAPLDYTITPDDDLGGGGAKTKARQNIAAIRLLKTLFAEDRRATAEEQAVLVKYVGWGGLKSAFDEANPEWATHTTRFPLRFAVRQHRVQHAQYTPNARLMREAAMQSSVSDNTGRVQRCRHIAEAQRRRVRGCPRHNLRPSGRRRQRRRIRFNPQSTACSVQR